MKRFLLRSLMFIGLLIFLVIAAGGIYIANTVQEIPPDTDETIDQVMSEDIPELVTGKSGIVKNKDVHIWYESIEPSDSIKGTVLMFMGIGSDALAWPEHFIDHIVDQGYRVIRFDNRGTGMSDWIDNWQGEGAYTLDDMALDGITILDSLGIAKCHLLGVSLGGMIAQQAAINHGDRVLSLTSMMSSAYIEDPDITSMSMDILKDFIRIAIRYGLVPTERNTIKLNVAARSLLKGDVDYPTDIKGIAEEVLYNLRNRNGFNSNATQQQLAATSKSGSRYKALGGLKLPTLIIHGTSDPLMPFEHGKKTAEVIPDAETFWVEGMGHDVPKVFVDTVVNTIVSFWKNSEEGSK